MWYGFAAIVLILSGIAVTGAGDRAFGVRRENLMILTALLFAAGIASIATCTVMESPG